MGRRGTFLVVQVPQRDEGEQKRLVRVSGEPFGTMKPSSDRSVEAHTEGGSTVGGWVGRKAARAGGERDRVMVGGWERAQWWRELIETSAPLQ